MQGQILDVAVTSNQGLILGDDGARYAFFPGGWQDGSVKAQTGMRVEFNLEGSTATDVSVIEGVVNQADAPQPPQPGPPAQSEVPPQQRVSTPPSGKAMVKGQILDAAITSNQGLILGDDGLRYTFGPGGWRDGSVKAEAEMGVEFSPEGSTATDVTVIQGVVHRTPPPTPSQPGPAQASQAPPPRVFTAQAPSQPPKQPTPPQMRQASYPPPASQPPPQPRTFTVPASPVLQRPAPPRPGPAGPRATFVPNYPEAGISKVTVGLLMILLGPLGFCIALFMMRAYPGQVILMVLFTVLGIGTFGVFFGIWYLMCLCLGIYCLAISERSWDRVIHFRLEHRSNTFWGDPKREAEHCLTGVCWQERPNQNSTRQM